MQLIQRFVGSDTGLERVRIIANGHDKRQQLSESLIFGLKFEQDAAGREVDSFRQAISWLTTSVGAATRTRGCSTQERRSSSRILPKFPAALAFIEYCIASRNSQVENQLVSIRHPITADGLSDNRRHQLLGTASSYVKNSLQGLAIYPWGGKCFELAADFVESTDPGRLVGHLTLQSRISGYPNGKRFCAYAHEGYLR
jgi:hypothetical protein